MGACSVMDGGIGLIIIPLAIVTAPLWITYLGGKYALNKVKDKLSSKKHESQKQDVAPETVQ